MENSIFQIDSIEQLDFNLIKSEVSLNFEHELYSGHFPNNPITPGVTFFQIIKRILQTHLDSILLMAEVKNAKFMEPVTPGCETDLIFTIEYSKDKKFIHVKNKTTFTNNTAVFNCNATFVEMTNR